MDAPFHTHATQTTLKSARSHTANKVKEGEVSLYESDLEATFVASRAWREASSAPRPRPSRRPLERSSGSHPSRLVPALKGASIYDVPSSEGGQGGDEEVVNVG